MQVLLDKKRVYLDYNATTPPAGILYKKLPEWLACWGNPSSIHQEGQKARSFLARSKAHLANFIGCRPLELILTSGGSEANNMAIKGLSEKLAHSGRDEIILSAMEHLSVQVPMEEVAQKKGWKIKYIPVSSEGELDLKAYKQALSERTLMVSCMYANNETGNIFPISKLVKWAHEVGAYFHCDAIQALGKEDLNLHKLGVDTASLSAHKFYSLKGTGVLYCRKGLLLENLIHGGPQERRRRAGTENVLGIACWAEVAQEGQKILGHLSEWRVWRDEMEKNILSALPDARVLGAKNKRLGNTSCIFIPGVDGETLLINMDLKGYSFSVGSACHSGSLNPSFVLMAMGLSEKEARGAIRVSLGLGLKKKQLEKFVFDLLDSVQRIRSFSRVEPGKS